MGWFRLAALQGLPKAQHNIGMLYHNGWGVPKDRVEAVAWYLKAADLGYAESRKSLREMDIQVN
jgi:TPR repeat protein